jgi:undecaprenyl-diphosphatase
VVLGAVAVALLAAFTVLAWVLKSQGWTSPVDESVSFLVRPWRNAWLTRFMWVASLPGDRPVIAPFTVMTAVILAIWGLRPGAVLLLVTMTGEALIQSMVATTLARPRPPAEFALIRKPVAFSFPSGHSWASLLFVLILGLVLWRTLPKHWSVRVAILSVASALALLVGASRVYLGVHWPSDVLGGWILALFSFVVASAVYLWVVERFDIHERGAPWGPRWFRVAATAAVLVIAVGLMVYGAMLDPLTRSALQARGSGRTPSIAVVVGARPFSDVPRRRSTCA